MSYNISMDICALLVILTILFYIFRHRMYQGVSNRVFIVLVVECMLTIIADILNVIAISFPFGTSLWVLYLTSYLFFILYNTTPFIYAFYVVTLTDTQYKIAKNNKLKLLLFLPIILNWTFIFLNSWFKWIFYYNEKREYLHGDLFPLLYLAAIYYLVFGAVYVGKYKNIISKDKQMAIGSMILFLFIGVIIQTIYPYQLVELFAETICILLTLFTLQKPEEVIDGVMETWNGSVFLRKISNNFYNERKFTVCTINISNYPLLNQYIGFQAVEGVIKQIAKYLRSYETINRELYYMGNGKFNIIFFNKEENNADKIASEINERLKQLWEYNEFNLNVKANVCIIKCPDEIHDRDTLIEFTDDFHNNMGFTEKVIHMDDVDFKLSQKKRKLEYIIEKAFIEKRFEVYYQPIISTKNNKVTSAEALLRLYDEEYGFIPPDEFIPVAEQNGSIIKLGMFVIETVCKFIASENLVEKGIEYIEINLSVVQCMQADFADNVLKTVKKYGVNFEYINLEITETAAAYSKDVMLQNMKKLTEHGITFSLDDYGTGYSNISYIVNLPFKIVKIDKSIICGGKNDHKMSIAMKNLVNMVKEMGFEIVAEGVETLKLVDELTINGCDYLQGYYFSKPVPGNKFLEYLSNNE